jgi:hypothetical protein
LFANLEKASILSRQNLKKFKVGSKIAEPEEPNWLSGIISMQLYILIGIYTNFVWKSQADFYCALNLVSNKFDC